MGRASSSPPNGTKNLLYYGDNLEILRGFDPETVDLVYIDPPFNSQRNYNVIFDGSVAEEEAFADTWSWTGVKRELELMDNEAQRYSRLSDFLNPMETLLGKDSSMYCYLVMMGVRVVELQRVLKPTGALYLHCDPTASHYLKILLDRVFGADNFRNEIIWKRTSAHSRLVKYGPVHDVILFFTKGDKWTWNEQHVKYDENYKSNFYRHVERGTGRKYRLSDVTSNRPGGRYFWKGKKPPGNRFWGYAEETMKKFESEGRLVYSKNGIPSYKRYLDEMPGSLLQDVWIDLNPLSSQSAERLGYPTQKPEPLLERIIKASSNKGDTVLDAFCGCGTTVAAAEKLGRRWIGIDITFRAIDLVKSRLIDNYYTNEATFSERVELFGVPKDIESAFHLAKHTDRLRKEFEKWGCTALGGVFQEKKGGDGGMDGYIPYKDGQGKTKQCLIQVKSGGVSVKDVREFNSVIEYFKADMGVFLSIEPSTGPLRDYLAQLPPFRPKWGGQELDPVPRIQFITVEDLFKGFRPSVPGKLKLEKAAEAVKKEGPRQRTLSPPRQKTLSPAPQRSIADLSEE